MDLQGYRGYIMQVGMCLCGCVSITHRLKWPPWWSRRLTVLMATKTRNIFFCDIFLRLTRAVGGREEEQEWGECCKYKKLKLESVRKHRYSKDENERRKEGDVENGRQGNRKEEQKMRGSFRDKWKQKWGVKGQEQKGREKANKRRRRTRREGFRLEKTAGIH